MRSVALLEQPLTRGREASLEGFVSPIPIAADESALTLADVAGLVGRFDVVNIKLDKCGGLTEGLAMAHEARRLGLKVMVGNMMGIESRHGARLRARAAVRCRRSRRAHLPQARSDAGRDATPTA